MKAFAGGRKGTFLRSLLLLLWLCTAAVSRCDQPRPAGTVPPPRPGDTVRLRGTLAEDVDCRVFRAENGETYSLSAPLRRYPNGSKLCVYGTVAEVTQCLHHPMIEVEQVRPWSSCP